MTVYLKDRVKQITATTGTGTITFTSTPSGYQSFSSAYNDGDEVYYVIENKSDYEIGVGTYTANTLSRDTVLKSTNGGAKLSLTGRSTVFVSVPAEKTVYIDGTGQASINLDKLSDVIITAPASGQGVVYNGTNWVNGNISGYTDEQAQDAVAGMLIGSTGINVSYNDVANTLTIASTGLLRSSLNLSDLSSVSTARANLELGTAALSNSGDFYLSTNPSGYISASSVAAGYQPLDGDLTSLAAATGTNTIYYRSASDTWSSVVIGNGISFSGGILSNTLDLSSYATSSGVAASYVPYTGATGAVNLGSQSLIAGAITTSGAVNVTPKVEVIYSGTTPATPAYGSIALVGTTFSASPYVGGGLCSDRLQGLWFPDGVPVMGTRTSLAAGATFTTWLSFGSTTGVGGQTSSFPGFNASGTTFRIRLADNSADAPLSAGAITASGKLTLVNGTTAQTLEVFNTYTSATNGEFIRLRGVAGANFELGPSNGSVGGTLRGLTIGGYTNGSSTITPWLTFDNAGMTTVYGTTPTFRVFHSSDSLGAILSLSGFSSMLSAYRDVGGANLYLRSSTGGTDKVVTLSAGGLCVRNYADSADAALTAGAITASGTIIAATKILFSGTTSTECGVINATGTRLIWGRNSTSAALITQSLNENAGGSGLTFRRGEGLSWSGSTSSSEAGGQTAYFFSEAANTYNFRNGLNAQSLEVENTYTSSTSREYGRFQWSSNEWRIGTAVGSAGGTQRTLIFGGWNTAGTWIPKLTIVPTVTGGIAIGSATTDRYCQISYSAGNFSASGDAQAAKFVLRIKTTDATATTMMLDGSTTRLTIPSGKMMFADIWISGIKSDGSASATYRRKAAIKNVGGTTSLIGSVETIGTDYEDNVLTDVVITADDTNDALQINVTGIAAETWRWVAVVEGLEIAYGT